MGFFSEAFPRTAQFIDGLRANRDYRREQHLEQEVVHLEEVATNLQLELENFGYRRLSQQSDYEFNQRHLHDLVKTAIGMAIKNPLTNRAVNVQSDYVFGRGVKFVASHPMIQKVIDDHVQYSRNQNTLYSHDSMSRQERELQVKGNLFFALVTNPRTGRVQVIDLDMIDVQDIVRDPSDYHNVWFFKRAWVGEDNKQQIKYHPALGITIDTPNVHIPTSYDKGDIIWDAPVYHAKFNYYGKMKFGIPEIFASIDWALAYKRFLEDWTTIMRSFARMAMKVTGLAGKKQAAAAKSMFQTSVSLGNPLEKNPSPTAASLALLGKGVDIEPTKTAGATTPAKDGQPLINMVAAGMGLPNTFFGDASAGNHATASTLDRPTELKMVARQRLWSSIFCTIFQYVIFQAALASDSLLAGDGAYVEEVIDPYTDDRIQAVIMPINTDANHGVVGVPISTKVEARFPELLERNVTDRVRALTNGLTLFGKPLTDIVPDKKLVCSLLMDALNIPYDDAMLERFIVMWTSNMKAEPGVPVDPLIIPPPPAQGGAQGAEDPSQGGDVGKNG